jgi:outer membrane protein insertion porin family
VILAVGVAFAALADEPSASEWYVGKPIENITFTGLRHVKPSELEGITEQYIGKKLDDTLFWELQGRLYALEYFEEITPTALPADSAGSEVVLRFAVKERPIISRIDFHGNKGMRTSELRGLVTLKVDDVYTETKANIDEQAIVTKYVEKGYPDVKVSFKAAPSRDGAVDLVFTIREGERITISRIYFEGNTVFSSRTLAGQLSLSAKGALGGLFHDGAFQESKLVSDKEAVAAYYHDRGYIDAAVADITREITRDADGQHLTLTFKINEGRQYIFEGIAFECNKIFPTDELQKLVHSKIGQVVNQQRVESDLQRVADLYYENGYIYNSITNEEKRDRAAGTIAYIVSIVERDRAYIEHIIVRGNKKTKSKVIFREIPLEVGDIFSKSKVMDALRNLYNLQYFSSVVPQTPPGSADGLLDLVFTVEEQPTTDIQAGLTFSGSSDPDAFPVSIMGKWTDRNFRGGGNVMGVEANVSPDVQSLSFSYTQKWLFGLPLSGGFDLTGQHASRLGMMDNLAPFFRGDEDYAYPDGFNSYGEYEDDDKTPDDEYLFKYQQWYISLGFSTGYRWLTPFGNYSLGGGARIGVKYNDYDRDAIRAFDRALRERTNWTPATSLYFSTSLDDRDVFYDPSRGYYLVQRFGIYGIIGNNIEEEYFLRTDSKAEIFFTIWNWQVFENWAFKGVLGLHTGYSLIFPQAGAQTPQIEQADMLSIDGMFTARGWTNQRLIRGLALWENWAELRIPIVPGVLSLDGFADAAEIGDRPGTLYNTDSMGEWSRRMRFSTGFGLRFAIPQFPFRFMFAKRFKMTDDGRIDWMPGAIGGDGKHKGMDFVLSFAVSQY